MAEHDTWPENPNDQSAPKPAKSSGGCVKVILIGGGLGLVVMLVCCGVAAWFGTSFMPKVTNTPAEVTAMAKEIMEIQIPEDFNPDTGLAIDNFAISMRMASFRHKDNQGTLVLGDFKIKMGDPNQAKQLQQQPDIGGKPQNLRMGDTSTREFTIRGKSVPFRFSDAVDEDTNAKVRVVEGTLEVPGGGTFIKLIVNEDAYDEDAVIEMIESIR